MPASRRADLAFRLWAGALVAVAAAGLAWALLDGTPPTATPAYCLPYVVQGDSAMALHRALRGRGTVAQDPVYVGHVVVLDTAFRCHALVLEGERRAPGMLDGTFRLLRPDGSWARGVSTDMMHDLGRLIVKDSTRVAPDLAACRARFERPDRPRPNERSACTFLPLPERSEGP